MHPVRQNRLARGISITELVNQTGLCMATICRIEDPDYPHRVNETVAIRLAEYFGCNITDLFTDSEVTNTGRPALTGVSYLRNNVRTNEICPDCWIELPYTGTCDTCAA